MNPGYTQRIGHISKIYPEDKVYIQDILNVKGILKTEAPVYIQKKVRLGIQGFPVQRVIAATLWRRFGVRNLLRASSIASPKTPDYIQKKVRNALWPQRFGEGLVCATC